MAEDLQKHKVDIEDLPCWSSERDLFAAVLSRAISDLLVDEERLRAIRWIKSNKKSGKYLTFLDVCETLDLDPYELRKTIARGPIKIIPR